MTPSALRYVFRIFTIICLGGLLFSCYKSDTGTPVPAQGPQRPIENMPQKVISQYYAFPKNDSLEISGYASNDFQFDYHESQAAPFISGGYRNSAKYQNELKNVAKGAYKQIVTPDIPITIGMLTDNYITFQVYSMSVFEPFSVSWRMSELEF